MAKKRNKRKKKENKVNYFTNIYNRDNNKIKDMNTGDAFGFMLHTRKSIELFQLNSGMEGKYTKEYQHHFWMLNGRLNIENQYIDIAIPLVLFNYEQDVSYGGIDFHLIDVKKVSDATKELAEVKMKEFMKTDMFKFISEEMGIQDWSLVPLGTSHVHPGGSGLTAFSGTDLKADVTKPGVCFPLSEGDSIPSFSSIMQHTGTDNSAQIVQSEYRLFFGDGKEKLEYYKGKCLTAVRGYDVELEAPKEPTAIEQVMGVTPTVPTNPKESYVLSDGFKDEEGQEFFEMLRSKWEECTFEPNVDMVRKENVKTIKTVVHNTFQGNSRFNKTITLWDKKMKLVNEKVFEWVQMHSMDEKKIDEEYEKLISPNKKKVANRKELTMCMYGMKTVIVKSGLSSWPAMINFSERELNRYYEKALMLLPNEKDVRPEGYTEPVYQEVSAREGKDCVKDMTAYVIASKTSTPKQINKMNLSELEEVYCETIKRDESFNKKIDKAASSSAINREEPLTQPEREAYKKIIYDADMASYAEMYAWTDKELQEEAEDILVMMHMMV